MDGGPIGPEAIVLELEMWLYEIQDYLVQLAFLEMPLVPFLPWEIEVFEQPEQEREVLREGIAASCAVAA